MPAFSNKKQSCMHILFDNRQTSGRQTNMKSKNICLECNKGIWSKITDYVILKDEQFMHVDCILGALYSKLILKSKGGTK